MKWLNKIDVIETMEKSTPWVKLDAFRDNYFPDMFGRFRWLRLPFCLNSASEVGSSSIPQNLRCF